MMMSRKCLKIWVLTWMKYKLVFSKVFEKSLKKLTREEQRRVAAKLKVLQTDPFYPSLRTKKIKGFEELFESSVSMDIRILWSYKYDAIIITLDIGHHSLVDNIR